MRATPLRTILGGAAATLALASSSPRPHRERLERRR